MSKDRGRTTPVSAFPSYALGSHERVDPVVQQYADSRLMGEPGSPSLTMRRDHFVTVEWPHAPQFFSYSQQL